MHSNKYFIALILLLSSIYSQTEVKFIDVIDLPLHFSENDFRPTNFSVNTTGFYFLDNENREIAFLSDDKYVIFSGGYGAGEDAFIDPIEIFSTKLSVFIVDGTENNLVEYDHKLNYLQTISFDAIYPEFSGIDDWGNIFLLSEQEQMVYKSNTLISNYEEFIDLSLWNEVINCVHDMHITRDGSIGILPDCSEYLYVFNRLGKLDIKYPFDNNTSEHLVKIQNIWFTIGSNGYILSIKDGESTRLPVESSILDVVQMDNLLYLLFSDKIWVVDVFVE